MRIKFALTCFLLLFLTVPVPAEQIEDEYTMKSVFIEGLTRSVTWPESSQMNDKSKPFIIGVIGKNPFGKNLYNVYIEYKNKIKGKRVEIRYFSSPDEIQGCHLLFISSSCKSYLADILAVTEDKPILTIGDTKGYGEKGVLVNLYITQRKLKFEINESEFHKTDLKLDSRILRYAKIVQKK